MTRGGRSQEYSIRINEQCRIWFVWTSAGPTRFEIVDYHVAIGGTHSLPTAKRPPTHPGAILHLDFLEPLSMAQVELASRLRVPFQRVNQIVRQRRAIAPDPALRLAQLFGMAPVFWLDLQQAWDLHGAVSGPSAREIAQIKPVKGAG
jgi:addiction module HigA family antidote